MSVLQRMGLIVMIAFLTLSCNMEKPSKTDPDSDHIKYFGFTLIDTWWDDPTDDEIKTNYIDEVASLSNVADILIINPTDHITERMKRMNRLQVKCILHLNELFFEQKSTDGPSGSDYSLRADYQDRWDEFSRVNELQANQDYVQAFYMGEEPTWNGISYEELRSATDYVDQQFPDIPIMLIEAYPILDRLQVPESVDWIGFDHYFIEDPSTNPDYQREWNLIKSKRTSSHQRMVVIMDSHYIPEIHGELAGIALEDMGEVAMNYYQLAKSDTLIIAMLGYFWPNGFDVEGSIGARGMPVTVKNKYAQIGREITGK